MLSSIILLLLLCVLAGIINGSFAVPIKLINGWKEENIWFAFCFPAFFIFPALTLFIFVPNFFAVINNIPSAALLAAVIGGLFFGTGQICMALSFRLIGMSLSFVITISICTAGGALIPICWNLEKLYSMYFLMQVIGVVFFTAAVLFSYFAGKARELHRNENPVDNCHVIKSKYFLYLGVFLACMSGIGGAVEGASFALSNSLISKTSSIHGVSYIGGQITAWVFLFWTAGIPYMIFFLLKIKNNNSFSFYFKKQTAVYWLYILIMGLFYWFSVVIFSMATSSLEGDLTPTIAWPLFMIAIIASSNTWSFIFGEWKNAGLKAKKLLYSCLLLFIIAVIIFSFSSVFAV